MPADTKMLLRVSRVTADRLARDLIKKRFGLFFDPAVEAQKLDA
ncbi:hypothetical protein [Komagataeibacter oboediens]|nr:hypothetical protein [Komagataeibacter oboediens]